MFKNINKIKDFLGFDIQKEKYALAKDESFGIISKNKKPDRWIKSTCGYCGVGCGLYIGVKNGKAVYTKGDAKHSVNMGTLCPKGLSEHQILNSSNRLTKPLIRKNGKLVDSNWEEVFSKVSDKFKFIQKTYGKKSIGVISTGQLLTEEFYTLGKFVQLGLETNNFDGNTTLCMASAVAGYKQSFGSDGATGCYEDLQTSNLILLIGANIAENHPILKLHLSKNRKDKKIIVIDPRKSKTAQMADIYLPIKAGTDLAFINGLSHILINNNWIDKEYIDKNCNGFSDFEKHLEKYPPQDVANITGISVDMLYKVAKLYAESEKAMSAWTMGVNQSFYGTNTVSALCSLALITGKIGKEGCTPFSITGQCNAMGSRETGFTSSLPAYRNFANKQDREDYSNLIDVPIDLIPTSRGYKYNEIIEAIEREEIKALWVVATNPLVSFPNQKRLRKAFSKLELLVVQDCFNSDTVEVADIVFSSATWGEKEGTYTNSERRCNKANIAVKSIGDTKSDFDIILEFSKYFDKKDLLFKNWKKPEDAFNEIKKITKDRFCDYSEMNYKDIENKGGIQWPCNSENKNGSKRLYSKDKSFHTTNKKANLICADWKEMEENICDNFPLILNTGRTVEQWHTRTKTKHISILDNLAPEAWVELNSIDAEKMKVKSGDRIDISSVRGKVNNVIVKVTNKVAPNNIFIPFHYNTELINNLTQSLFDPISGEPNFKQTAVQIHSNLQPNGLELEKIEIIGELENQKVENLKDIKIEEINYAKIN